MEAAAEIQQIRKSQLLRNFPDGEKGRLKQAAGPLHAKHVVVGLHGNALLFLKYSRHVFVAQVKMRFQISIVPICGMSWNAFGITKGTIIRRY